MNNNNNPPNKTRPPSFITIAVGGLLAVSMFSLILNSEKKPTNEMEYSTFIKAVKDKRVDSVVFEGDKDISGTIKDPVSGKSTPFKTIGDTHSDMYNKVLYENNLIPNYRLPPGPSLLLYMFVNWLPMIFILGFAFFMLSKLQSGVGARNSITNLKTSELMKQNIKVRFKDVAGVDEAKEELKEIVDFLKDPKKFTTLGGRLPKGALLVGPPGTGKTLLARAVAGEAEVPFFSISGSNFIEVFVGVGASRVRNLFEQAKMHSPCIIFIDEIDSIGRSRSSGSGMSGSNDEREQTLNQLLVEMDGFEASSGIILLGATNRPDVLDQALLRPGRFDRRIFVSLPDVKGREQILKTHSDKKPLAKDVDLAQIARGTAGLSGAELENLINEAAIYAAKSAKSELDLQDFERAKDKILMGVERKSMVISNEEKKTTAYHEIGHTLVSKLIKGMDPFHKVSIIPRGQALGITMSLPEDNRLSLTKDKAENMIAMLMGGRIAEEIVFNHVTTGAANDLERATQLARRMVCEWGMSEKLGPMSFPDLTNQRFGESGLYSSEILKQIEGEIRDILQRNHDKAKTLLTNNLDLLHKLSKVLLEKETLDSSEVDLLIVGEIV